MSENLIVLLALLSPAVFILTALVSWFQKGPKPKQLLLLSQSSAVVSIMVAGLSGLYVAQYGSLHTPLWGIAGIGFSLRLDALSVLMLGMIALLAFIIIKFSLHYLAGDVRHGVFMGRLAASIAAVQLLVLAGNIGLLFFAWVLTSLSLHRLLLFYPERLGAQIAARKKFIMARLGDVCLLAALFLLYQQFGSGELEVIFSAIQNDTIPVGSAWNLEFAALFLAFAAILKSAQFPTHGWLIEVMETPTPVSALLHAGILNAGPFLILRMAFVMDVASIAPVALMLIGGLTALFASAAYLTQTSVKTALGYSSVGHMGFSLMVCGLGVYPAAMLHLVAHSFYKAHAFLSSGSIIDLIKARKIATKKSAATAPQILLGFSLALFIFANFAWLWRLDPVEDLALLFVGGVVVLGLSRMLTIAIANKLTAALLVQAILMTAVVSFAFFGLETAFHFLLASQVPTTIALSGPKMLAAIVLLLLFSAVVIAQILTPPSPKTTPYPALAIHMRNGFYANAWFDKLVGALALTPSSQTLLPTTETGRAASGQAKTTEKENIQQPAVKKPLTAAAIIQALREAAKKVAPLWPLENFVAVNPYLGHTDKKFSAIAQHLATVGGIQMTLPLSFYYQKFQEGSIKKEDIEAALAKNPTYTIDLDTFIDSLASAEEKDLPGIATLTDVAAQATGTDWSRFSVASISTWAASYFDKGQATWKVANQQANLFEAWKTEASIDLRPEIAGLKGFREVARALPPQALAATQQALDQLAISEEVLPIYLYRLLLRLGGWAAYIAQIDWDKNIQGQESEELIQFLAVLLCWEAIALQCLQAKTPALPNAWQQAKNALRLAAKDHELSQDMVLKLISQEAFDIATQRELVAKFQKANTQLPTKAERPKAQAIFCIDVRSEVFRRNLERLDQGIATMGFAGFFAFPIHFTPLGHEEGEAQCPVLLAPGPRIVEEMADKNAQQAVYKNRILQQQLKQLWKAFKSGAVSCFSFVSPMGLTYLPKLYTDSFGLTRPVPDPQQLGWSSSQQQQRSISLQAGTHRGQTTGIPTSQGIQMAKNALKAMSLTDNFAPFVLIAGHGATTVNNPHASGLDCGACGGKSGEPNAKVAAAVLNDPAVRKGLEKEGIHLPQDTIFLACLHNTTTDEISIYNESEVPAAQLDDLNALKNTLAAAGKACRAERALRMDIGSDVDREIIGRSKDWSQVRPEWGLAGCTSFVVASRDRTKNINLGGQTFLHSYEWSKDEGFPVLELIMTAPMVVASWINLQYYASTVDNQHFGSGNKTLHNLTAGLGVLEGYSGDLRVGLPMQSIHDGEQYQHEPLRLNVVIEAPIEAQNAILEKHPSVKNLCDNGWINLFTLDEEGKISHQYQGDLAWEAVDAAVLVN